MAKSLKQIRSEFAPDSNIINKKFKSVDSWMSDIQDNPNKHLLTGFKAKSSNTVYDTIADMDDHISKKLRKQVKFDHNESNHIKDYTDDSSDLNKTLLSNHKAKLKSVPLAYEPTVKGLDSILANKNKRISHDLSVFSGVSFNPKKLINKDGLMHSPAYISTTHSKDVAYGFSPIQKGSTKKSNGNVHIIHFHLKKGDPAVHISGKSHVSSEHETLIGRGVTLKHHGVTKILPPNSTRSITHIHHMTIVNDT